ncbi:hypothetical protein [Sphingomonas xanthus]|uniref:hypothetical protein n=1 Tax=Sphingomonas xanthus TaxID=2594473 RepID=UPI00164E9966|nr:hypothetical protein [Sphingomonas xanthus]
MDRPSRFADGTTPRPQGCVGIGIEQQKGRNMGRNVTMSIGVLILILIVVALVF